MKRLWIQLAIGFAVVALLSTLIVAIIANTQTLATFRGYLVYSQIEQNGLPERLIAFYAEQHTWQGVENLLPSSNGMTGMGHAGMRPQLILSDPQGLILADPNHILNSSTLSTSERAEALPLIFDDQIVGLLFAATNDNRIFSLASQRFLANLNIIFWSAGTIAVIIGILLGLLMASRLAAPLGQLTAAARQIATGAQPKPLTIHGPTDIEQVAQAFNEMITALDAGEQQRRQMVADIAHELRTPLTVIQGNLRAILDGVYPLTIAEVARIYESSQGLRHLVNDLRELSLAEAGQITLHQQPIDLAEFLKNEADLFYEEALQQGLELQVELPALLPPVYADPSRLTQILHNLISNALRYTPTAGLIRLRAEPDTQQPDMIRCMVIDSGIGIAANDIPLVFDRFYRSDPGRARTYGGSGLGLAITKQFVQLHGGTIGVESSIGQGSTFWFTLPSIISTNQKT